MGLSIGETHWAYGGFADFRRRLAFEEDINLDDMAGFEREVFPGSGEWVGKALPWHDEAGKPITVLEPLLNHSDCGGELTWEQCDQIVDRLEEILQGWEMESLWKYGSVEWVVGEYVRRGEDMVEEMRKCIANKESLEFA